jgi:hypothetical protein
MFSSQLVFLSGELLSVHQQAASRTRPGQVAIPGECTSNPAESALGPVEWQMFEPHPHTLNKGVKKQSQIIFMLGAAMKVSRSRKDSM